MAGKHTARTRSLAVRARVKIPLSSNWAIEYLRQLQLGNQPLLDNRARITIPVDRQNDRDNRLHRFFAAFALRFNRIGGLRFNRTVSLIVLSGLVAFAFVAAVNQFVEPRKFSSRQPKSAVPVCKLETELQSHRISIADWITFGGIELAEIESPCDSKKYRVLRDAKTKELLRLAQVQDSS